jgi:hypothetical protein
MFKRLLFSVVAVSLNPSDWQQLKYSKIAANELEKKNTAMVVKVEQSASPLIYIFDQPQEVSSIEASGKVDSPLVFKDSAKQGEKGQDDFQWRLGLVVAGEKKLGGVKALFAADWIKKLFSLGKSKAEGIDRIQFYNLASQELDWQTREHPLSDLIQERVVGQLNDAGRFQMNHKLDKPLKVLAIWLSIDGDDTKSNYQVQIDEIKIHTK